MAVLFPKARKCWHGVRDFFRITLPLRWRRCRYGALFGAATIPAPVRAVRTTLEWISEFRPTALQKRPEIEFIGDGSTFKRSSLPRTTMPEALVAFRGHIELEVPPTFLLRLPGGRTAGLYGT